MLPGTLSNINYHVPPKGGGKNKKASVFQILNDQTVEGLWSVHNLLTREKP